MYKLIKYVPEKLIIKKCGSQTFIGNLNIKNKINIISFYLSKIAAIIETNAPITTAQPAICVTIAGT